MLKSSKPSAFHALSAQILIFTLLTGGAAQAQSGTGMIEQRVKSSLNTMVQEVHATETPDGKRAVLNRFLVKVSRSAAVLDAVPFLSGDNHAAIEFLQERFDRYAATLHGDTDGDFVADGDLDSFASFMQQDLEQASNGVYLSTGAIIIVLLIILILL
jgi:hypothetical protein